MHENRYGKLRRDRRGRQITLVSGHGLDFGIMHLTSHTPLLGNVNVQVSSVPDSTPRTCVKVSEEGVGQNGAHMRCFVILLSRRVSFPSFAWCRVTVNFQAWSVSDHRTTIVKQASIVTRWSLEESIVSFPTRFSLRLPARPWPIPPALEYKVEL
jgi:hypothetical protein